MAYLEQSHPLHRLRHPHRRPLPLLPRPRGARQPVRHPLRRRHGPAVRHLRRAGAGAQSTSSASAFPKDRGRLRLRLPPGHQGQGVRRRCAASCRRRRCRTSASTAPARPTRRCCCGCGRTRCPRPASTPTSCSPSCARSSRASSSGSTSTTGAWPGAPTWRRPGPPWRTSPPGCSRPRPTPSRRPTCGSLDCDPDGEVSMVAAMLYPYTHLPEEQIERQVRAMTADERLDVVRAYVGDRSNRRHKPGRALERPRYRFDVLADYGAFRDLQRHRMLTIEWQALSPRHGYTRPEAVDAAGVTGPLRRGHGPVGRAPRRAARAVPGSRPATRCASPTRSASSWTSTPGRRCTCSSCAPSPQGHPAYRRVAQEMHRLIAEQAGHRAVAELMRYVDHSAEPEPRAPRRRAPRRTEAPDPLAALRPVASSDGSVRRIAVCRSRQHVQKSCAGQRDFCTMSRVLHTRRQAASGSCATPPGQDRDMNADQRAARIARDHYGLLSSRDAATRRV